MYLAEDLRHERKVALKVLKPELAAVIGADRFLAEIKTTANLQHPHILPLFDSGQADSFLYYVMPYVEGETLGDRIDREKQLPVDEAVVIASKVASALQHAHEQGVIHRDIKPANILLQSGEPVVADFGIALAVGAAGGGRLTETGLSVGTPFYMSPEQATGDQEVGPGSDTYGLACVLYETLVGEPPYPGNTAQAVLGKIIQGQPVSATAIRKSIPANVDAAIRKALEKLPADRFAAAQDLAKALADPSFRHGEGVAGATAVHRGLWNPLSIATTGVGALAIAVAIWLLLQPDSVQPIARFESPFREGQGPVLFGGNAFDLSTDGSMLVYRGPGTEGPGQLWVRRWEDPEASPIRGTALAIEPTVYPSGQQLAFRQGADVKVLSFEGGPIRTVAEGGFFARWGPDGYIYVGGRPGVERVPATGGPMESVTQLLEGDLDHLVSDFLPGGDRALVSVRLTNGGTEVRGLRLDTGEMTTLTPGFWARYAATGHLTFVADDGSLMAAPFESQALEITGPPVPLIEGVNQYALSDGGTLIYSVGGTAGGFDAEVVWMTRSGTAMPIDADWRFDAPNANYGWSLSPDGGRVAVTRVVDENIDIWVKQLPNGPFQRLTFDDESEWYPVWTPDGEFVTYLKGPAGGNRDVWQRRADGTGEAELLLDDERSLLQGRWSADMEWMVFRTASTAPAFGPRDVVAFRPGADSATIPLIATAEFAEEDPALSPDGAWLAYTSDETGQREVYVRPFPEVESGRWQVSTDGGSGPLWAKSGSELFFVDGDQQLIAAAFDADPSFRVLERETLFGVGDYLVGRGVDFYDVALDDQRFLMARVRSDTDESASGSRYVLVQNFFEELRQLGSN